MPTALIVDDDSRFTEAFAELLRQEGLEPQSAASLAEARRCLQRGRPDAAFLDLMLPDGNGIELIEDLGPQGTTRIVVITGHASFDTAVGALRARVWDYLVKPLDMGELRACLRRLVYGLDHAQEPPEAELDQTSSLGPLIGASPAMRHLYRMIGKVAPTEATVLLAGESGTGKELAARAIHDLSRRAGGPFLALNCGAVSGELIGSEVFGHERGSFTGADRQHRGYFERADGGTLFLDEVTEMPIGLQVNLLRVLEQGTLVRLGGAKEISVDVRLVAATNRDPQQAVAEGRLREDLHYRLMVFPLRLPPLRERRGDVRLLAEHFLAELNRRNGTSKALSSGALAALEANGWPGNVRELRNALERAYILAEEGIDSAQLGDWQSESAAAGGGLSFPVGTSIDEAERRLIVATLEHYDGDKKRTAGALGISLKTLYNRLNAYKEA